MPNALRLALAILLGLVAGSLVNGSLIAISGQVIQPPAGADVKTMEGLKASLHLFEPRHFLFPFLAHALGTLVGAYAAARLAPARAAAAAWSVGGIFLLAGIANVMLLPAPAWFNAVDLLGAYLPMAWIGLKLATRSPR